MAYEYTAKIADYFKCGKCNCPIPAGSKFIIFDDYPGELDEDQYKDAVLCTICYPDVRTEFDLATRIEPNENWERII